MWMSLQSGAPTPQTTDGITGQDEAHDRTSLAGTLACGSSIQGAPDAPFSGKLNNAE